MANQQVNKVIAFAGAGASAALGLPTTPQFIDLLRRQWKRPDIDEWLNMCKQHRNAFVDPSIKPPNNNDPIDAEEFRDWLAYLEQLAGDIDLLCNKPPCEIKPRVGTKSQDVLTATRQNLDTMIRKTYGQEVPIQKARNHYEPFLSRVIDDHQIRQLLFFTTNYDLTLDSMVGSQSIRWHIETGIKKLGVNQILDLEQLISRRNNKPTINLIKVHGSIDWWRHNETRQIEWFKRGSAPGPDYRDLIIYPTRTKSKQVHEAPFSDLYRILEGALQKAKLCIVIGYSFRDIEINRLFEAAIETRKLRFLVFDLNAGTTKGRIKDTFKQKADDTFVVQQLSFGNWNEAASNSFSSMAIAIDDAMQAIGLKAKQKS